MVEIEKEGQLGDIDDELWGILIINDKDTPGTRKNNKDTVVNRLPLTNKRVSVWHL